MDQQVTPRGAAVDTVLEDLLEEEALADED